MGYKDSKNRATGKILIRSASFLLYQEIKTTEELEAIYEAEKENLGVRKAVERREIKKIELSLEKKRNNWFI